MKIEIRLRVQKNTLIEDVIDVDDIKFEELTEEEKEHALEIVVRNWADENIQIEWEVQEKEE